MDFFSSIWSWVYDTLANLGLGESAAFRFEVGLACAKRPGVREARTRTNTITIGAQAHRRLSQLGENTMIVC